MEMKWMCLRQLRCPLPPFLRLTGIRPPKRSRPQPCPLLKQPLRRDRNMRPVHRITGRMPTTMTPILTMRMTFFSWTVRISPGKSRRKSNRRSPWKMVNPRFHSPRCPKDRMLHLVTIFHLSRTARNWTVGLVGTRLHLLRVEAPNPLSCPPRPAPQQSPRRQHRIRPHLRKLQRRLPARRKKRRSRRRRPEPYDGLFDHPLWLILKGFPVPGICHCQIG